MKQIFLNSNPLKQAELIKEFITNHKLKKILIIVPETSDINLLESFFIDLDVSVFSKQNFINTYILKDKKRVDFIELNELFKDDFKLSLLNEIINTILELKFNNFNTLEDIDFVFKDYKYYSLIKYTYLKYSDYLIQNNLFDDADLFKLFIEQYDNFNEYKNFIIFGFNEFLSHDLEFIKKLSNNVNNSYVFTYDIFKTKSEYVNFLKQNFISLGFVFTFLNKNTNNDFKTLKFNNIESETIYIKNKLYNLEKANIYPLTNTTTYYYKLKKYFKNDIKYLSSLRIDKSNVYSFIKTLLEIKQNNFNYNSVVELAYFKFIYKNNSFLKFIKYLEDNNYTFSNLNEYLALESKINKWYIDFYVELKNIFLQLNEFKKTNTFFNYIDELINLIDYMSLSKRLNLEQLLELNSFIILINKLKKFLNKNLSTFDVFILKLEEITSFNYVINGVYKISSYNMLSYKTIAVNTFKDVIICGFDSKENFKIKEEDTFIKDSIILKLRAHNYLRPSSFETSLIKNNIYKDLLSFYEITTYKEKHFNLMEDYNNKDENFNLKLIKENDFKLVDFNLDKLSPSSILNIIKCPYIYFMNNVLSIDNKLYDEIKAEELNEGIILHSFLDEYIQYYIDNSNFDFNDIYLKIHTLTDKLIINNKINKTFLLENLKFKIANYLIEFLPYEIDFIKSNKIQIVSKEKELKLKSENIFEVLNFNNIILSGRIDRLDYSKEKDLYYIIDYKRKTIPKKSELISAKIIQAQLYLLMLGKTNSVAIYSSIKNKEKIYFNYNDLEDFKDNFINLFKDKFSSIKESIFFASPSEIDNCKKCIYRSLCCTNRT